MHLSWDTRVPVRATPLRKQSPRKRLPPRWPSACSPAGMPSQAHAVLVNLFRQSESLTLDLLRTAGVEVRDWQPAIVDSTRPVTSADYHVDLAVRCNDEHGRPRLLVLVEIQLRRRRGQATELAALPGRGARDSTSATRACSWSR